MARTVYELVDRQAFGGGLAKQLKRWRRDGLTYDQIARRLEDHDVEVSRETVRRWLAKAAA